MKTTGERGDAAKAVISPLLPQIYDELDRLVNEFANDPGQCFESPDDFPVQAKLAGQYYLGSETMKEMPRMTSSVFGSRYVAWKNHGIRARNVTGTIT